MSKGASASQTGLSQQAAEPEVSALTGFDPSRAVLCRVAQAICCHAEGRPVGCAAQFDGSEFSACQAATYMNDARAAIAALLTTIDTDRVVYACAAAKAVPGDVWGQAAEGHYAFLCGLSALLELPSEVADNMIAEGRRRSQWWAAEHPESSISDRCPARIFSELGFPASAIEARRAETHSGSVADESAGPQDDAQTEQ